MPDITQPRSNSNNGTATPATTNSITSVAGNLLIVVIGAIGTSPTIATPTSAGTWIQIQKSQGAVIALAAYMQANTGGGAINPSSVLGGTVTGWLACILEFTQTGANCALQGSNLQNAGTQQNLPNAFPSSGQTLYNELFVYTVLSAAATLTPQNSFISPNAVWSPSVQSQTNVQGLSLDTFWASGLGQGVGQYPTAAGALSASVAQKAIAAWFNTLASNSQNSEQVGGASGVYVPQFYQGVIGG